MTQSSGIKFLLTMVQQQHHDDDDDTAQLMAIKFLWVLSQDTNHFRNVRSKLRNDGAVEALVEGTKDSNGLLWNSHDDHLFYILDALANLLELFPDDSEISQKKRMTSQQISELRISVDDASLEFIKLDGLSGILNIVRTSKNYSRRSLIKPACRLLLLLSPRMLEPEIVRRNASAPWMVLTAWQVVLEELIHTDCHKRKKKYLNIMSMVLHGLATFAQVDPFKTCIMDEFTPDLMQVMNSDKYYLFRGTVRSIIHSLLIVCDDDKQTKHSPSAVTRPTWLADEFCLQRSLLIQAMARDEICKVLSHIWDPAIIKLKEEKRISREFVVYKGDQRQGEKTPSSTSLFPDFCQIEKMKSMSKCRQQYDDFYGIDGTITHKPEGHNLLANQVSPLCSFSKEAKWISDHAKFMKAGSESIVSSNTDAFLDRCFPSKLLKEQIIPTSACCHNASFDFRSFLMPSRHYPSFDWEVKILLEMCHREALWSLNAETVHISLVFTDSSFTEDFAESLREFLYQDTGIYSLSFASENSSNDKSPVWTSFIGLLPPHISHLTLSGILDESDLEALLKAPQWETSTPPEVESSLSFLAIKNSKRIDDNVWRKLFDLRVQCFRPGASQPETRTFFWSLKSLDLSDNELGDELCSLILKEVLEKDSCLEELDLSGNKIANGKEVIKVLRKTWTSKLRTLKVSDNELYQGDAWLRIIQSLGQDDIKIYNLDFSSNGISPTTEQQIKEFARSIQQHNKELVHLNLSNNKLRSDIVDVLLTVLENENYLAFLELNGNDPKLTPEQSICLHLILMKRRCELVVEHNAISSIKEEA